MEVERLELIGDLDTAQGENLEDAALRGGEWVHKRAHQKIERTRPGIAYQPGRPPKDPARCLRNTLVNSS
jgi:hypothetical protein